MSEDDRLMIARKYVQPTLGSLWKHNKEQFYLTLQRVVMKIHVITGWRVPANEMLDILLDQMEKRIIERYPAINEAEIEHAFRNNTVVKDYGKNLNLNTVDEVLLPYLSERYDASLREERMKTVKDVKMLPAAQVTDEEFIISLYKTFTQNPQFLLIPTMAYDILKKTMQLSIEQKRSYLYQVAEAAKSAGAEPAEYAKRWAVAEYFIKCFKEKCKPI
jgi:hypothetical protein